MFCVNHVDFIAANSMITEFYQLTIIGNVSVVIHSVDFLPYVCSGPFLKWPLQFAIFDLSYRLLSVHEN